MGVGLRLDQDGGGAGPGCGRGYLGPGVGCGIEGIIGENGKLWKVVSGLTGFYCHLYSNQDIFVCYLLCPLGGNIQQGIRYLVQLGFLPRSWVLFHMARLATVKLENATKKLEKPSWIIWFDLFVFNCQTVSCDRPGIGVFIQGVPQNIQGGLAFELKNQFQKHFIFFTKSVNDQKILKNSL